ncbi:MAG: hypothetical protein ACQERN_12090 [Thermodesulfobacteriota bacterium]
MPEITMDIKIKDVAQLINKMNKQEFETLYLFLTGEGEELQKRNKELKNQKVDYLSENEVFDV